MFSASQMKKPISTKDSKQRHAALAVQRAEDHRGARVEAERARGEVPAVVADVVVGEEVRVDRSAIAAAIQYGGWCSDPQVEQAATPG